MDRSIFHQTFLPLLAAFGLASAASDLAAQGRTAYSVLYEGCSAPAPRQSLRPLPSDPVVVRADPATGTFAVEIEAAPAAAGWSRESALAGFSGSAYYRWTGGNLWSSPGRGVLEYRLFSESAGRYRFALHNRHDHWDASLENDCWIRINGGSWWKLYSNTGSNVRVWNWHSRLDPGHGYADFDLREGVNLVEISGRSDGFMIDRLHAYPTGFTGALTLRIPSLRMRERPVVGNAGFGLRVGDPHGETDLQLAATRALLMLAVERSALRPCGELLRGFGPRAGTAGEFLLAAQPAPMVLPLALPVELTSREARVPLPIPAQPALVGSRAQLQGVLFDGRRAVLTNGLTLGFGDR